MKLLIIDFMKQYRILCYFDLSYSILNAGQLFATLTYLLRVEIFSVLLASLALMFSYCRCIYCCKAYQHCIEL